MKKRIEHGCDLEINRTEKQHPAVMNVKRREEEERDEKKGREEQKRE